MLGPHRFLVLHIAFMFAWQHAVAFGMIARQLAAQ
jgi:hypothetical protein